MTDKNTNYAPKVEPVVEPKLVLPEEIEQKLDPNPEELIFENKEMLAALLIGRKNHIFERMISSEMMNLMIDHFIKTPPEYMIRKQKCTFVKNFLDCLLKDFGVDMIEVKSNRVFAQGAHGKVYESDRKTSNGTDKNSENNKELIKIIMNHEELRDNLLVFDNIQSNAFYSTMYDYASELFTYIVWFVVLQYISGHEQYSICKKKKRTDSIVGVAAEKTAEKVDYTKYIVKINKPFIAIRTGYKSTGTDGANDDEIFENLCNPSQSHADHYANFGDNIRLKFCVGYYMKRYENSLNDLLQKSDQTINYPLVKTTLTNVFVILHEFDKFSNLGIHLMHRDITSNNIVVDDNGNVTIIDLGMALVGIKFQNNMIWNHGTYFREEYVRTIQSDFDTILFIMFLAQFHENLLSKLNVTEYFEKLIGCDQATKKRYDEKYELVWLHPYVTRIQNLRNQRMSLNVIKYLTLLDFLL